MLTKFDLAINTHFISFHIVKLAFRWCKGTLLFLTATKLFIAYKSNFKRSHTMYERLILKSLLQNVTIKKLFFKH